MYSKLFCFKSDPLFRKGAKQLSQRMTKPTKWHVRQAKTQFSIRPVWSESPLSAWRKLGCLAFHNLERKTKISLIRLYGCPDWSVFAGRTYYFVCFVIRWLNYDRVTAAKMEPMKAKRILRQPIIEWTDTVIKKAMIRLCACAESSRF